jgi:DNA-binding transcriptional LysR family regulator
MEQNLLNFSVHEANLFCVLYETGNTTEASKKLKTTSTQVSITLSRLEKKIGKEKLFIRNRRLGKFIPTKEADEIIQYMRYIVQFAGEISAKNRFASKHVLISSTHSILENYLGRYIPQFIKDNPSILIGFRQNDDLIFDTQEINEITLTCFVDDIINKKYFPYHSFRQKLWASPEYIKKYGNPTNVEELKNHRLLMRRNVEDPRMIFGSSYMRSELSDDDEIICHDIYSHRLIDFLCERGCGIMAAAEESIKLGNIKVENVFPDYKGDVIDFYVCANKDFLENEVCKKAINWIFESRDKAFNSKDVPLNYEFTPLR